MAGKFLKSRFGIISYEDFDFFHRRRMGGGFFSYWTGLKYRNAFPKSGIKGAEVAISLDVFLFGWFCLLDKTGLAVSIQEDFLSFFCLGH